MSQELGPVQEGTGPSAHARAQTRRPGTHALHPCLAQGARDGLETARVRSDRPLRPWEALETITASAPSSAPPRRQRWDPDSPRGCPGLRAQEGGLGGDRRLSATRQGLGGPFATRGVFMGHKEPCSETRKAQQTGRHADASRSLLRRRSGHTQTDAGTYP